MKVLLSIKPEFAFKILNGSKRYEYRRTIFKHPGITRVIVYVSNPIKHIIGEFEIDSILFDEPKSLWYHTKYHAGISEKKFFEYFSNRTKGYAIKVKETRLYDSPLLLSSYMISSPPQSFMYI